MWRDAIPSGGLGNMADCGRGRLVHGWLRVRTQVDLTAPLILRLRNLHLHYKLRESPGLHTRRREPSYI
jgi:hypothetical protein